MGPGSGVADGRVGVAQGLVTGVTPCAIVTAATVVTVRTVMTVTVILVRARYCWSLLVRWLVAPVVAAAAAQWCSDSDSG